MDWPLPPIRGIRVFESTTISISEICSSPDQIVYLSCRIPDCNCQHHICKAWWDFVREAALWIRFGWWYWLKSWFPLPSHALRLPPPATCPPVPVACNSASLWIEHPAASLGAYSQVTLGVSCLWSGYLGACLGVCLRASGDLTWGCKVQQAGSIPWSAIASVFESIPGSVLESMLWAYFSAYGPLGWECTEEYLESVGVWNQVHLAVVLNAAWPIVSTTINGMYMILIESTHQSIQHHSVTCQICQGFPSPK